MDELNIFQISGDVQAELKKEPCYFDRYQFLIGRNVKKPLVLTILWTLPDLIGMARQNASYGSRQQH